MYNWNKEEKGIISSVDYIQEMETEMDEICKMLSTETKKFDAQIFLDKVNTYITKNERLLYTHITNYIFTLDEKQFGILQTNIDSVVSCIFSGNCGKQENLEECEKLKRTVLKIWDHTNLARRQYLVFCDKDEEYTNIVSEKMELAEIKISKEMNIQLISLVAIFTALSFLVFGGISSLDNIFAGVKDVPVLKLVIIGCIWSFCITNLIFAFMFFVAKMTRLSISSTENINANLIQKYPLVWWSNFAILSVLSLSCWIYYIRRYGYSKKIDNMISHNPTVFALVGVLAICVIMVIIGRKLFRLYRKKER